MSLIDRFHQMSQPGKSMAPFYEVVAAKLDDLEKILAPLRTSERLPVYDGPLEPGESFLGRLRACSGNGDVQNWLRDVARGLDAIDEALTRIPQLAQEVEHEEPVKRGPGRPRKAA